MKSHARVGLLCLVGLPMTGCGGRFPVEPGQVLTISRASAPPSTALADDKTLRVQWLGTACYLIQLGEVAILTDPFVSYHGLFEVGLGRIESDPATVDFLIPEHPVPDAVFIGHSHYDHMLDLGALLKRDAWGNVPVQGSLTAGKIMCGWGPQVASQWRPTQADGLWHDVEQVGSLKYMAVRSQHAPNLPGILLYPGDLNHCLCEPPTRAADFKLGDTYAYLFQLSSGEVEFTVFFMGAASGWPINLPADLPRIDLAIFCVPGWKHVNGYPEKYIERLRPRHILLSHFDNFLQNGRQCREVVATAHLNEFLKVVRAAANYPEFESIIVPDVGAVLPIQAPTVAVNRLHGVGQLSK